MRKLNIIIISIFFVLLSSMSVNAYDLLSYNTPVSCSGYHSATRECYNINDDSLEDGGGIWLPEDGNPATDNWITIHLNKTYSIKEILIYEQNPDSDREIVTSYAKPSWQYSTDNITWIGFDEMSCDWALDNNPNICNTTVEADAKHIRFTNWSTNDGGANLGPRVGEIKIYGEDSTSSFQVTTTDIFDSSLINSTVTISNSTYTNTTNTTNGEITFYVSDGLYNITVEKNNYHTLTYSNYDTSVDLETVIQPYFRIISVDYSNYKVFNNSNYVRNLTYLINYTCLDDSNTTFNLFVNSSNKETINLSCNNETQIYSSNYTHSTENNYNITFYLNTSYNPSQNNYYYNYSYFISDLYNPIISLSYNYPVGFTQAYLNITLTCSDNVLNQSEYVIKLNGNSLFLGNRTNNYSQTNLTTEGLTEDNVILGNCRDLFGNTNKTLEKTLYHKNIYLIDEINGSYFNLNVTSAIIYFDDNSSSYNFKTNNNYEANFTSDATSKLRIELGYSDGSIINRYLDTNLIGTDDLRVCANQEGLTHYEQLIISSTVKPAVLKSVYSDCIVAADYTRFAYQDTKLLKAFTIDRLYYLYTFDNDNNQILLASTDGSISSYMNIDTLEFQNQGYNINVLGDVLTFKEDGNNIILYYNNLDNDNENISLTITNMDTNALVLSTNSFTNPNNWTVYFDYTTLSNVTNQTLFSAEVARTLTDGTSDSFKRYFNIAGSTGVLSSPFVMIISILLSFFGLTFTLSRTIFSWFGALVQLINIALLSFSISTWYILLWLTINVIVLVYIILIMIKQNYPTISG